jgi:flagellar hook-associated protein 2
MSSIAFAGLATGLDTAAIVSQLVEIRRQPIYRLETRKQGYQNEISALGSLKTKLLALQKAAQNLDSSSEFSSLIGTSADEDALRVTAGSGASPGTYDITVDSLAVAQKNLSQGFDSKLDSVGSGTLSFTINGETTDLNLTGFNSVESLANLINDNVQGVSASIVYDGSDTGGYHMILTGDEAGSANAFTVDTSGLSGGVTPAFTLDTPAADAHLTIDNIAVTTSSNSPSDVISGLTLDLVGAGPDPVRVEVKRDDEGIAENVKAFVDAYNDLAAYYEDQRGSEGVLRSNPTLRSVFGRVENIFSSSLEGGLGSFSTFARIGITRGDGRQYDFDNDDFVKALQENFGGVRDLLVEREGNVGKAALLDTAIESLTDSVDGLFKMSTDLLNTKIDYADKSIERYERSVETYKLTMERKYAAMEQMVSSLQAQGSYLNSMTFMNIGQ